VGLVEAAQLARFWAAALRWEISGESDGLVSLMPTDPTAFTFDFALGAGDPDGNEFCVLTPREGRIRGRHAALMRA
jgi:hypothetical protein